MTAEIGRYLPVTIVPVNERVGKAATWNPRLDADASPAIPAENQISMKSTVCDCRKKRFS